MPSLRHVLLAAVPPAVGLFVNGSVVAPCDSELYCHGRLLDGVQKAHAFKDSKTFVDMGAIKPVDQILAAFDALPKPLRNDSTLQAFLADNFHPAGGELQPVPKDQLRTDPVFLKGVKDPVVREFVQKVMDIWPDLTRVYKPDQGQTTASSFIPIKRPFVVAGGRFREPYYWDSYWILEGLLRTGGAFTNIAHNITENFLDLVDQFGFVPNGARVYYLNRSQPPVLAQMVRIYVEHTGDKSILDRALPLLIKEHDFWTKNRSVSVQTPAGQFNLSRYDVQNTVPRPESYREDFETANNQTYVAADGTVHPEPAGARLDDAAKAQLYGNLAAAAESGWDFTSRWLARPGDSVRNDYFPLRSLNTRNVVPVCLNSVIHGEKLAIASFFEAKGDKRAAGEWRASAAALRDAMHAVLWNETHFGYFDYNLTSSSHSLWVPRDPGAADVDTQGAPPGQQLFFHIGQLYPWWTGAVPDSLQKPTAVRRAFARVARYLDLRAGAIAATNLATSQQWDQPNVWPPLMHILMQGLRNTPKPGAKDGKANKQDRAAETKAYCDVDSLALRLGQRYIDSTFCTWYATGGSTSQTPKLAGLPASSNGIMFEKYNSSSINVAGGGGEYDVVEGFGWTNGVAIWTAQTFGDRLKRPNCGNIKAAKPAAGKERRSAVELHSWDARWVKKFGRAADAAAA